MSSELNKRRAKFSYFIKSFCNVAGDAWYYYYYFDIIFNILSSSLLWSSSNRMERFKEKNLEFSFLSHFGSVGTLATIKERDEGGPSTQFPWKVVSLKGNHFVIIFKITVIAFHLGNLS